MSEEHFRRLKAALANVSSDELRGRVRDFRRTDIRSLSDKEISDRVFDILCLTDELGVRSSIMKTYGKRIVQGTNFYRARPTIGNQVPPLLGNLTDDALPPPPEFVRRVGRVNGVGEPILYTVLEAPEVTLHECRLQPGEHAVIFEYISISEIKFALIGAVDTDPLFTNEELEKINIINDFLHDEFSYDVENGLEHRYRVSNHIMKTYFTRPDDHQDCWLYSSTQNRNRLVAAFTPEKARACLRLVGAVLAEAFGEQRQLRIRAVGRPEGNSIMYYPVGSDVQRQLFPWIRLA